MQDEGRGRQEKTDVGVFLCYEPSTGHSLMERSLQGRSFLFALKLPLLTRSGLFRSLKSNAPLAPEHQIHQLTQLNLTGWLPN
jgi:hypothetical protein